MASDTDEKQVADVHGEFEPRMNECSAEGISNAVAKQGSGGLRIRFLGTVRQEDIPVEGRQFRLGGSVSPLGRSRLEATGGRVYLRSSGGGCARTWPVSPLCSRTRWQWCWSLGVLVPFMLLF